MDEIIKLWDVLIKREDRTIKTENKTKAVSFSEKDNSVTTANIDGGIDIRDFENWQIKKKLKLNFDEYSSVIFTGGGDQILFTENFK